MRGNCDEPGVEEVGTPDLDAEFYCEIWEERKRLLFRIKPRNALLWSMIREHSQCGSYLASQGQPQIAIDYKHS